MGTDAGGKGGKGRGRDGAGWGGVGSINPLNVDVRRRGTGRGHRGISYSAKFNRENRETRSANSVEFRAIISPFDANPSHARVPRPRAASLSLSLISRVNPASLNRARWALPTYRFYPFFSLCTSFDKNVAFVGGRARCRRAIRFPKSASLTYVTSLSIVYISLSLSFLHLSLSASESIFSL